MDVNIGVSYNAKIDCVKEVLAGLIASNELILKEPEAFIGITSYGDSSINFMVKGMDGYCRLLVSLLLYI